MTAVEGTHQPLREVYNTCTFWHAPTCKAKAAIRKFLKFKNERKKIWILIENIFLLHILCNYFFALMLSSASIGNEYTSSAVVNKDSTSLCIIVIITDHFSLEWFLVNFILYSTEVFNKIKFLRLCQINMLYWEINLF